MLQHTFGGVNGPRSRAQRDVVLRVLADLPGPSTAHAIHHHALDTGVRIGLTTIYRHLASLVRAGTVAAMVDHAGLHLYYLRSGDEHSNTLMCTECGCGVPVNAAVVTHWAMRTAVDHGFSDLSLSIALTGVCSRCRSTEGR
ncbi:zinc uptake transcriptional repressor Zur [Saccharothrix mutabilis subsp. mutabilis]|uniref:Zinc uptake transcriptional repressor Zur n=1 Tax=Saccharothrix mutabilis subsp. mutabilis TaxID=66855 RepID=A0ABN0UNG4_9PSEU